MGALSPAAVLIVDYLFKSTAVQRISAPHLAGFFARFYVVMNIVSLGVQVLVTQPALRRLGVIRAAGVLPVLLAAGGIAAFFGGGSLAIVFTLKVTETALCCSLNRVATELLYLPVPETLRDRTRGIAESMVGRGVKACTGGLLYLLTVQALATPRVLAMLVLVLSAASASLAFSLRRAYCEVVDRHDTRAKNCEGPREMLRIA
jgi:ATP/ADP translocase